MPILTIENGSGVANANSYVDLTYLEVYTSDRGLSLPSTNSEKEIYLLRAMDYLEARRDDYSGHKSEITQSLQWPRTNATIDCIDVAVDAIPEELKKAQCQLVVELQKRTLLFPVPRTSSVEGVVTQKTVGPLTKKFSQFTGFVNTMKPITIISVEIFLRPLMNGCCNQTGWKRTIRA